MDAEDGFEIRLDVGGRFGMDGFEFEDDGVGTVTISDGIFTRVLGPTPTMVDVTTATSA